MDLCPNCHGRSGAALCFRVNISTSHPAAQAKQHLSPPMRWLFCHHSLACPPAWSICGPSLVSLSTPRVLPPLTVCPSGRFQPTALHPALRPHPARLALSSSAGWVQSHLFLWRTPALELSHSDGRICGTRGAEGSIAEWPRLECSALALSPAYRVVHVQNRI